VHSIPDGRGSCKAGVGPYLAAGATQGRGGAMSGGRGSCRAGVGHSWLQGFVQSRGGAIS